MKKLIIGFALGLLLGIGGMMLFNGHLTENFTSTFEKSNVKLKASLNQDLSKETQEVAESLIERFSFLLDGALIASRFDNYLGLATIEEAIIAAAKINLKMLNPEEQFEDEKPENQQKSKSF